MVVVYVVKARDRIYRIYGIPFWGFGLLLFAIPIVLSLATIGIAKFIEPEKLNVCEEFSLADNEFLPTYLGYFFVSLSINDDITMVILYVIIFLFTFLSQAQYFNPIFLLFGYHYYHILTPKGTRVFVIAHGKVIRNKKFMNFQNLRRINDTTFIEWGW
jgi:hypothetical protein